MVRAFPPPYSISGTTGMVVNCSGRVCNTISTPKPSIVAAFSIVILPCGLIQAIRPLTPNLTSVRRQFLPTGPYQGDGER